MSTRRWEARLFRNRRRQPPSEAEVFIAWMRENYGVELTLDDEGLRLADQLADRLKHTSGERRRAVEQGLGEFVATVLNEKHGGTWDSASGTLTIPGAPGLNVAGWAVKRLHYGREDSLVTKARVVAELASPTPEPDWDPRWPEDFEAADELATALRIGEADRRPVDAALGAWLRLRKSTYLDRHSGRNADDDALDEARESLCALSADGDSGPYALARRHKAHAWLQHWRFGRSLGGRSSFLVDRAERVAMALDPPACAAVLRYLAPAPQFREHSLLDMVWRIEKTSGFRVAASADVRRRGSLDLLRLIADAHAWSATPHIKRFVELIDADDPVVVDALRQVHSDHWPDFWLVVLRILFAGERTQSDRGLRFGAEVLTWLDSSRGRAPTERWRTRREVLVAEDARALDLLTEWLDREGERIHRDAETGEVIEPIARWVKSALWHRDGATSP